MKTTPTNNILAYGDDQARDATADDPGRTPVDDGRTPPAAEGRPIPDPPAKREDQCLCAFEVKVDLPRTMFPGEMEAVIADCIAIRLPALGHPGNVIVTLMWTSDKSVLTETDNSTRRIE